MSSEATLFESQAFAELERALGFVRATDKALDATANALLRASAAGYRDLEKVRELHRLAAVRLEVFIRRLGEGLLSDEGSGVTP